MLKTVPLPGDAKRLIVFADDWGRHPSSCQHLIRRLLPKYETMWVNTIGMRRPALNRATFKRAANKLHGWFLSRPRPAADANPEVVAPLMWPWCGTRFGRAVNLRAIRRQLMPLVSSSPGPLAAITTIPLVVDLIDVLPVDHWIYYCVDDFSKWPGLDGDTIQSMEDDLIRRADVIISVSERLQQQVAQKGRESYLLTHGVDLELWQMPPTSSPRADLNALERPRIVFWGSIDWQTDVQFVRTLARDLKQGTILFVGPLTDPDPRLFSIERVVIKPAVPYEELPGIAQLADALIMPYADLPGLRESQPLKLKEYLATEKPVIVRDLPANRVWADSLDLVQTAEEFSETVRRRLAEGVPEGQRVSRRRLSEETWEAKAEQFDRVALGPQTWSRAETV